MNKIKAHEQNIQPGCVIQIRREPPRARRYGFMLGSEHVIQHPPENKINSQAGVYVKCKNGKLRFLYFPYFKTTGKTVEISIKRTRLKQCN